MKTKNHLKAWIILGIYLAATCVLLFLGYSVKKPSVERHEFPFSITYSYQGKNETLSGVYAGEYVCDAKYIGDDSVAWFGYIEDHDRLALDYYVVEDFEDRAYSINLNIKTGYLMGDPAYAGYVCEPSAQYNSFDGTNETIITDPAELEQLGFSLVSWEYPEPIENTFSFGGIRLSSEGTAYTSIIAVAALLLSMILIRKDPKLAYGKLDKISIVLNFAVEIFAFPYILVVSMLSEIVADASFWQQILYFSPAMTTVCVAASLTLRRLGYKHGGFWIQFVGPAVFALCILIELL